MTRCIGDDIHLVWKSKSGTIYIDKCTICSPGIPGAPYDFYCRSYLTGAYPIGVTWDDEDECYKGVEL